MLIAAASPLFHAAIPITNYLTSPRGFTQKAIESLLSLIPGPSSIAPDRTIPALAAFYIFWTFAATGAASAAGLGASRKEGLDNSRMCFCYVGREEGDLEEEDSIEFLGRC